MRTEILIALIKIRHYMGEELFQNRRLAGTLEEALGEIWETAMWVRSG